jgi:hypothetical protein
MKIIMLLALGIIVACIVVTGCETKKDIERSPSPTFAPFHLRQGQVTIYVGGLNGEIPVFIDKMSVGVVSTNRPMTLMIDEGNHTVKICCGKIKCVYENVTIRFGKPRTIDFSEQLEKDCEFLEPTVRVVDYFLSGDQITVNVEFINPTMKDLAMSAEIKSVYSYIESRSNNRVVNSAGGWVFSTLKSGDRATQILRLNLARGSSYIYEIPTISRVSSK